MRPALPVARRHKLPLLYEIRAFWEDAAVGNGTARPGYPAQAKVANEHGQNLYVSVEPEAEGRVNEGATFWFSFQALRTSK